MPNTALGKLAVDNYAKYLGIPVADFVDSMKSPQTPHDVAEAVVALSRRQEGGQGSVFTVSSEGIAKVP
jgi:hypothetical protein